PRFGLARDDLQLETGFFLDSAKELAAVLRCPAGFGGDQPPSAHFRPGELVGTDPQRFDGPSHRWIAEPAGYAQAFAQTHDPRESVNDFKSIGTRRRDQQPAVVGAEIQRSIKAGKNGIANVC